MTTDNIPTAPKPKRRLLLVILVELALWILVAWLVSPFILLPGVTISFRVLVTLLFVIPLAIRFMVGLRGLPFWAALAVLLAFVMAPMPFAIAFDFAATAPMAFVFTVCVAVPVLAGWPGAVVGLIVGWRDKRIGAIGTGIWSGFVGGLFGAIGGGVFWCISLWLSPNHQVQGGVGGPGYGGSDDILLLRLWGLALIGSATMGAVRAVAGVSQIQEHLSPEYQAPFDRFRDNLASPIPTSVANLRFVPLKEQIRPDLMLRFDIDRADLDAILQELGLKRVAPDAMLNPKDFFRHAYYMPIEGAYHLFQGKNKAGEVLTVKTSESHSHAIFRRETLDFYGDRRWENGRLNDIYETALEKIRKNYEANRQSIASLVGRGSA